ncbi:MAG: DEAD/DEAH box helicase family protein [Bacteroides heparinolyticus]|nr:DEAD/DEAH box helicase family protein [Bacteroides heparinolyticus]
MTFKELDIKPCYESGTNDIIEEFYDPVLSLSTRYDRIAGFFSSSAMAIVARGLSQFIHNGGRMRLITSPILNPSDADIIKKFTEQPDSLSSEDLCIDLQNIADAFTSNHVKALGWLLQNGYLDIKLAVVVDDKGKINANATSAGLFHQKVGVLTDAEGNELSFSGSINETASAWVNNDEEFKVFKAWSSEEYFSKDKSRFEEYWNNQRTNTKVFDLPTAVKSDLISYAKDFDRESISLRKYKAYKKKKFDFKESAIPLFPYQVEALNKWKSNHFNMLFEMATGTGKTRTAIAGIAHLFNRIKSLVVIISTPQNTLSKQWLSEIRALNVSVDESITADGTINNWRAKLRQMLFKNGAGLADHCMIFTTHNTASSDDFTSLVQSSLSPSTKVLFVGDEVHWLGAGQFRKALKSKYQYRIGLSATPSRWFDDEGTEILLNYFGNENFVFSIHEALTQFNPITNRHFLVCYNYNISKVSLNEEESENYKKITKRLIQLSSRISDDSEAAESYRRLLEKRANIIKNAHSKYNELERILDDLKAKDILEDLIIFVSPQQIETVKSILVEKGVLFHKLTEQEGTRPEAQYNGLSEREHIIKQFKAKEYQALVAIKCLDEGIDIPSANKGILMASGTNPREYVQRIGRIIRQADGKVFADLYDICVSSAEGLTYEEEQLEKNLRKKEIIRLEEVAENAINSADALKVIISLNK